MNILLSCPSNFSLKSNNLKKLGGVESLNIELAKTLSKQNFNITLATNCKKKLIKDKIVNIPINELKKMLRIIRLIQLFLLMIRLYIHILINQKKFCGFIINCKLKKQLEKKNFFQ